MAYWGVEVKPGQPYAYESSGRGRLRITQATLGNPESVGWSTIACSVGGMMPVMFCALNSTSGTYRLDLEYEEEQNVVFSVIGDSSVHLTGYYKIPDAAANVQALVTQSQEADVRETTPVHDIPQEHNALDTDVCNDGTNQMVQQASLNIEICEEASPGSGHRAGYKEDVGGPTVKLGIEEQKLGDCNAEMASDGKEERNALDPEVRNDGTNQMVQQAGLNIEISDEASSGSGHRPGYKEDIGGTMDELGIKILKLVDCNAKMATDGKKVKVKYIGKLKDGTVVDSKNGRLATCKFTLGAHKVIAGLEQGIQGMRVGEKRRLTIPPALAYKDKPQKELIPPNSWLVYDIELRRVLEPGEEEPKKKSRSVNRH